MLSNVLYLDAVRYDLIELRVRVAVVIHGLEYLLAEVIHCFGVVEAFC